MYIVKERNKNIENSPFEFTTPANVFQSVSVSRIGKTDVSSGIVTCGLMICKMD
jgi:hypothetical protein